MTASNTGVARTPGSVTSRGLPMPVSLRHETRRPTAPHPKRILVGNEKVLIASNMTEINLLPRMWGWLATFKHGDFQTWRLSLTFYDVRCRLARNQSGRRLCEEYG